MKQFAFWLLVLVAGLFLARSGSFAGQTYKVVDKNGKVSYKEISSPTAPRSSPQTHRTAPRGRSQVDIYVTNWCGHCRKAIAFLDAKGIPYNVYDIEKDSASAKRYSALSGKTGVPFAVINGQKLSGFSETAYKRALNIE
jgi:glutaredoxin